MKDSDLTSALSDPAAYPGPVDRVGVIETHISRLFFAGDRVYKVKKPVDLGFLDFTTLERREHFCREELRLNRRLAPWVYRDVVPVVRRDDGRLGIGTPDAPPARVVDWAVEMERLPAEGMLSARLAEAHFDNADIRAVVELLVPFHAGAPTGPGVDEHGTPEALGANVEENFAQLDPFVGRALSAAQFGFLRERQRGFLSANVDLLQERVAGGHIREGHGDLHAENLCFTERGVVAYDCIEFNRRFRCGDVAADLAFLAMDLDRRGFPSFSRYLVKRYAEAAGDPQLRRVLRFYKTYRALVRAKVAALGAAQCPAGSEQQDRLLGRARDYAQLASAYQLAPALILSFGGDPGALARPLRASVFQGRPGRRSVPELFEDTLRRLERGWSVVLDVSWAPPDERARLVDAAARLDLPYHLVDLGPLEPGEACARRTADRVIDHLIGLHGIAPPRPLREPLTGAGS